MGSANFKLDLDFTAHEIEQQLHPAEWRGALFVVPTQRLEVCLWPRNATRGEVVEADGFIRAVQARDRLSAAHVSSGR